MLGWPDLGFSPAETERRGHAEGSRDRDPAVLGHAPSPAEVGHWSEGWGGCPGERRVARTARRGDCDPQAP